MEAVIPRGLSYQYLNPVKQELLCHSRSRRDYQMHNLKELLRDQAEENRSLALEQAEDRAELMKKHKAAREEYRDEFMKDKSNRKAVKEVMNIL